MSSVVSTYRQLHGYYDGRGGGTGDIRRFGEKKMAGKNYEGILRCTPSAFIVFLVEAEYNKRW